MKKYHTYFFDIDGTIFKYRQFEKYSEEKARLTPSAFDKLIEIKNSGHMIILTTARPEDLRGFTIRELGEYNIPYDQLIMGLARGTRHLINDLSPEFNGDRAISWNLTRNEGLTDIEVTKV